MAELPLDHPEGVLHLGPDAGLDPFQFVDQNIQRLVFADVEGQRHQESMDMAQKQYTTQTNSVLIQQQMLDRQRKATADDNPSMPTE